MADFTSIAATPSVDYTVVGAGPAGLCAIAKLLSLGTSPNHIAWIDPVFRMGDFGSTLSVGSSIPSNTTVKNFQQVNQAIYASIPTVAPSVEEEEQLTITQLSPSGHCSLKIAAEPMQRMSNAFRQLVRTYQGTVVNIRELQSSACLEIDIQQGKHLLRLLSARVILATGAKPKAFSFQPPFPLTTIPLNTAMIASELYTYLKTRISPETVSKVVVVGSSHSAALAVMNLLREGIAVKQLMNKPYRFAVARRTADGVAYTQFDNTGLKGEAAAYIQELLASAENNSQSNPLPWENHIYAPSSPLSEKDHRYLEGQLQGCSHIVAAIGYEHLATLTINGLPLHCYSHNSQNTQIGNISGLFGLGIAFPQKVQSPSGEIEAAVGYSKFWATVNHPLVVDAWQSAGAL
ncbi:MAG: FAD-dependent oxidoreductase [Legionella sp.]|nr:FAD-dependent oxidoreductase [Legionella sp.]